MLSHLLVVTASTSSPPPPSAPLSLRRLPSQCTELVLGWSTGHTGTTSLCDPDSYTLQQHPRPHFFFEVCSFSPAPYPQSWTIAEEEVHARDYYFERMQRQIDRSISGRVGVGTKHKVQHRNESSSCVDLSHYWLSFARGLLSALHADGTPYRLVRLRRDALETAYSFVHDKEELLTNHLPRTKCKGLFAPKSCSVPAKPDPVAIEQYNRWAPAELTSLQPCVAEDGGG